MVLRIAVIFCLFFFSGFGIEAQEDQQFEGFNLVGYDESGEKSWDVTGDTADILGNTVRLTNIVANAYGEETINLTAKTGSINKDSGHIHLEKDVVITSERGSKMTTDSLDWEKDKDLVTTEDQVNITDGKLNAVGKGARARPNLKTAQLKEDVTVKVNTELDKAEEKIVTITCDGPLNVDRAKQVAVFHDNVVAIQEGRRLKADKMEVYFDEENQAIKEIVALDNVILEQGDNKSFSDKAIFLPKEKKVRLLGRPKLILYTEGESGLPSFGD